MRGKVKTERPDRMTVKAESDDNLEEGICNEERDPHGSTKEIFEREATRPAAGIDKEGKKGWHSACLLRN